MEILNLWCSVIGKSDVGKKYFYWRADRECPDLRALLIYVYVAGIKTGNLFPTNRAAASSGQWTLHYWRDIRSVSNKLSQSTGRAYQHGRRATAGRTKNVKKEFLCFSYLGRGWVGVHQTGCKTCKKICQGCPVDGVPEEGRQQGEQVEIHLLRWSRKYSQLEYQFTDPRKKPFTKLQECLSKTTWKFPWVTPSWKILHMAKAHDFIPWCAELEEQSRFEGKNKYFKDTDDERKGRSSDSTWKDCPRPMWRHTMGYLIPSHDERSSYSSDFDRR